MKRWLLFITLILAGLTASQEVSAALALDGNVGVQSGGSCPALVLTTANANDVIVVVLGFGGSPTTPTSAHLTFTQRATTAALKEWTAIASSALTSESISIVGAAFCAAVAFGISGANTSTIFDSNGALPAIGTTSTVTVTTSNANDFLIGSYTFNSTANPTSGAGWTQLGAPSGGFTLVEYMIVSSAGSNVATVNLGAGDETHGIGDAIIQAGGVTPTVKTIFSSPF